MCLTLSQDYSSQHRSCRRKTPFKSAHNMPHRHIMLEMLLLLMGFEAIEVPSLTMHPLLCSQAFMMESLH